MKSLFGSWSNQIGFPVLNVTRNYKNNSILLSQEKYEETETQNKTNSSTWWIPYNFATPKKLGLNSTRPNGWLQQGQKQLLITRGKKLNMLNSNMWILFNKQQTGNYRVCYDDRNYKLLSIELNHGDIHKIHPLNRAQILDDLHEFVRRGKVSAKNLCGFLTYLKNEIDYAPWEVASMVIHHWYNVFLGSKKLNTFERIIKSSVEPYYLKSESHDKFLDTFTQITVGKLACMFGIQHCLDYTHSEFKKLLNGERINPNKREFILENGIRSVTDEEMQQLWNSFLNSTSQNERDEIIKILGNIRDEKSIKNFLTKMVDDYENKKVADFSDCAYIIDSFLFGSLNGVSAVIQFYKNLIDRVINKKWFHKTIFSWIAQNIKTAELKTEVGEIFIRIFRINHVIHSTFFF